jgi:hypothetical protein
VPTLREDAIKHLNKRAAQFNLPVPSEGHDEDDIKHAIVHVRHQRQLRRNWPKGKHKMAVVLEFIKSRPKGLLVSEIRQFVWEMNGYRGMAKRYYWMSLLKYAGHMGKKYPVISLLDGWCVQDPVTKRWRFRGGQVIAPPYLKRDMRDAVTARDYRRLVGHDPWQDGIRLHNKYTYGQDFYVKRECFCQIPDDHVINITSVPEKYRPVLGFRPKYSWE